MKASLVQCHVDPSAVIFNNKAYAPGLPAILWHGYSVTPSQTRHALTHAADSPHTDTRRHEAATPQSIASHHLCPSPHNQD